MFIFLPSPSICDRDTEEWRQVGNMLTGRKAPYCGLVNTGSEKYVVVAGGNNITYNCYGINCYDNTYVGEHLTSVETFSLEDETWRRNGKTELIFGMSPRLRNNVYRLFLKLPLHSSSLSRK